MKSTMMQNYGDTYGFVVGRYSIFDIDVRIGVGNSTFRNWIENVFQHIEKER